MRQYLCFVPHVYTCIIIPPMYCIYVNLYLCDLPRRPRDAAVDPGTLVPQPNHLRTTFLAKISPNPNMTPFTNGKSKLIARAEANDLTRVEVERVLSKTESVAEVGAVGGD